MKKMEGRDGAKSNCAFPWPTMKGEVVGDKYLVQTKTPNRGGRSMGEETNIIDKKGRRLNDRETTKEAIIDSQW